MFVNYAFIKSKQNYSCGSHLKTQVAEHLCTSTSTDLEAKFLGIIAVSEYFQMHFLLEFRL